MKNFINKITLLLALTVSSFVFAQQEIQFTQYMYNTVVVNPAYAGSRDALSFNTMYRTQWVGLDGAPKTLTFSAHDPMANNLGIGVSVVRDEIGPSVETSAVLDFSYTIRFDSELKFAFGMKGGMHHLNVDFNRLNSYDPTDIQLNQNISKLSPQIGVGTYLYSEKWYLGVSTPNVLNTEHYNEVAVSRASERLHLYALGGYVFQLNHYMKFKPAALLKMVSGSPISLDFSANVLIHEKLTIGASYRWNASISALAGFQISKNMMLGYAYDFDTTSLSSYNSGSHEFFLRFELTNKASGKVSPRFF